MIYTITFNPALDYVIQVENFKAQGIYRTRSEHLYPGGKGNNVAVVAANLGVSSRALGFKAGMMGNAMEQMLKGFGCNTDFIALDEGETRINVKVKSEEEFEINGQGPKIPEEKIRRLLQKLKQLTTEDVLVLSGSIPNTLPNDMYELFMKELQGQGIRICVDASGELLLKTLKYHPFLIKPNHHEIEELFGDRTEEAVDVHEETAIADSVGTSYTRIIAYAKKLQELGARNVLVSMAKDGAILVDEQGTIYRAMAPQGVVVNSVGAGDSMVAGFLAGYLKTGCYEEALRYGTAAGSATAFTSWLAGTKEILDLLEGVDIKID